MAPPKKVLCAFTPGMLEQINFIAKVEHRTRSDLIREALRRYIESFKAKRGFMGDIDWMEKTHPTNVVKLRGESPQ